MPWRGGGGRPRKRPCVSINICSPSPLAWPSRERPRFNRVRTCDSHKWGFQPAPLTQPHRTKPPAPCGSPDSSLAPAHQAKQGSHPPEPGQAEVLCTRGRVKGWPSSPSSLGTRDTHLISHRHFPAKETLRPAEKRWACLCPPPISHTCPRDTDTAPVAEAGQGPVEQGFHWRWITRDLSKARPSPNLCSHSDGPPPRTLLGG